MTPELFAVRLDYIGWTYRGLADRLGVHETRVRRWASGKQPVPQPVGAWLNRLATAHARYPAPEAWEQYKALEMRREKLAAAS